MKPEDLQHRLAKAFAGEDADILAAFSDSATATDGSTSLTPLEVVEHLAALPRARMLHVAHDERSLSILIEFVDEATGLGARESWSFVFEGGLVRNVLGCCGGPLIQKPRTLADRVVEPYLAGFGLRYPRPADEFLLRRAADAVSVSLVHEVKFELDEALLNDEIIYVPCGWIGCVGFLVERSSWTPILLGSAMPLWVHVWAYYRGFADGATNTDRPNDLVITSIRDRDATRHALRRLGDTLDLDQLPARIRGVDLYFSREDIWKAELKGDFCFRVEPSSVRA